jgi:hypothetical protein
MLDQERPGGAQLRLCKSKAQASGSGNQPIPLQTTLMLL